MALNVRVLIALVSALVTVFVLYVLAQAHIDRVQQEGLRMRLLSSELRQSSEDLTHMARSYVFTGEARYKQLFHTILDIRDGRLPRPPHDGMVYWDRELTQEIAAHHQGEATRQVPLMRLLQHSGATAQELELLAQAKERSDALAHIELAAMALLETPERMTPARRSQAAQMLFDEEYRQAKAAIMEPINRFMSVSEHRTQATADTAAWRARLLLVVLITLGLATLAYLILTHRLLRTSEAQRQTADARTAESELRLQLAYQGSQDALWEWNLQTGALHYSPRWWQMIGMEPDALPVDDKLWRRVMHPQDLPRITRMLREQMNDGSVSFVAECRLLHQQGYAVPVLVRAFIMRDAQGRVARVSGTNMDMSERVHAQQMDALRGMMLERLTGRMTLLQLLDAYARKIEAAVDDVWCAVILYDEDEQTLRVGAAPTLPEEYQGLLLRTNINPRCGPCATAVAQARRVVVPNLPEQHYTADYLSFVHRHGLVACWVEPIRAGDGRLLGTFTVYRKKPSTIRQHEFALVEMAAHITAIAIERRRTETQLQLAAKVFEQGGELIMITDASGRLLRVNQAFTKITGYSEADALGRNPSMLASGQQDEAFYKAMWAAIDTHGHWQGEVYNRRKDGTLYAEWLSVSRLCDADGMVTNYVGIGSDITQRKQDEEKIRMLADFDPLTGLPNRRLLQDRVATALHVAQRQQEKLTLIFLDLDRFKNVNDSLGHHVGDELLVQVARRLTETVRQQDTVCRMGGDEFVLLCPDTDSAGAAHLAGKLQEAIGQRYYIGGQELSMTTSIGLAIYPEDGDTFETLSMRADTAMYRAKQGGRNAFRFFTAEMQDQSARALQLENGLRRALDLQQFTLVYQPQLSLQTGKVLGVEALIRWYHPALGWVSPAEFIPVAEESGMILQIGEWVLRTAARQLHQWRQAGLDLDLVAVNLSAVQFRHPDLPSHIARILDEVGLAPQHLELELTEGVALQDPVGAIHIMQRLHERGVRMSIDDFGTGYSSLSYLKRFNVYKLKIDQSFVRDITEDAEDRAIVEAIIGLARSLGFLTIAEGVETPGQLAYLREHGCDEVQGYFYSRPLAPDALHAFVLQHQRDLQAPGEISSANHI